MIYSFIDPIGASLKKSPMYVNEQQSNFIEFSCLKIAIVERLRRPERMFSQDI